MIKDSEIRKSIESILENNGRTVEILLFPFGEVGERYRYTLKNVYGIETKMILDNHLCHYNPDIKPVECLKEVNMDNAVLVLTCINKKIYDELKSNVLEYIPEKKLVELSCNAAKKKQWTKRGKYSYGPLCNHWLVESVGAFSSFAVGCDVVANHLIGGISVHPFLYLGKENNELHTRRYVDCKNEAWYFDGILPKKGATKLKKSIIGNDVWLGKNVLITNGANIGNGVIAAAGAVITKDVPDYAIVGGVPARIIRYRYTPEQIEALNRIQWWNWSDDEIRERYDDFYLSIEEFIEKYDV